MEEQERIAREGATQAKKAAASFERTSFDDEADLQRERRQAAQKKNEEVAKVCPPQSRLEWQRGEGGTRRLAGGLGVSESHPRCI